LDNWQEERFIEVTAQLYQDLAVKEEALKELEAVVQETKQAPSIATVEAIPMEEKEVGKGVCNKPLKSACRSLEEGKQRDDSSI
jgi:hypothetical protein